MSADKDDNQTMITQYQTNNDAVRPAQQTDSQPNWVDCQDDLTNEQHCQRDGCGESVTEDFRLVFGDDDDLAHACKSCESWTSIKAGAAAHPDFVGRVNEGVGQ